MGGCFVSLKVSAHTNTLADSYMNVAYVVHTMYPYDETDLKFAQVQDDTKLDSAALAYGRILISMFKNYAN